MWWQRSTLDYEFNKALIQDKNEVYKRFNRSNNNSQHFENFQSFQNLLRVLIETPKEKYYSCFS